MGSHSRRGRLGGPLVLALLVVALSLATAPGAGAGLTGGGDVQVMPPVEGSSFDGDLADAPIAGPGGRAPAEGRLPGTPRGVAPGAAAGDGSARTPGDAGEAAVSGPLTSFTGSRNTSVSPPDPTGEIGPSHFVEAINLQFQIFNRSGVTLAGPSAINTIWTGAAGLCEANNDGDPIVLYDQLANRWVIAQFAVPDPPWSMCVAVSKTSNPVSGGWWRYEFVMPDFPDYEKFGIWRDGLYMTTFEGALLGAHVLDYGAMKAGDPAAGLRFTIPSVAQTRGTRLLPADTDGETFAPAGAPNVMLQTVDADLTPAVGDVDRIELFEFHTDFDTPGNSTFTKLPDLPTAPFDNSMCYGTATPTAFRDCIPQPGFPASLDPITNRPLWRASYRRFGDHQSIVFNQTVDTGGDHAGIRWYELRRPISGGAWSIFQQGTYSPDNTHRWMGSAAINRLHEIGLGYTASSSSVFPSIRYAGRVGSDPPGQLGLERTLVSGAEAQPNGNFNRWGDYSHMSIDPLDDCTMWYVGEFGDRRTQVGSFRVSDCVPDTSIAGPSKTRDRTPTFELSGDEPDVTLQCALDGAAFSACPASFTTPKLAKNSSHALEARAIGVKGAIDPSPASFSFKVDNKVSRPKVKASKKQKAKGRKTRIKAKVGAGEKVEVTGSGKVEVGNKKFKLKKARRSVKAGKKARMKLKPASKSVAKKLAKALKSAKGKAKLRFAFRDGLGNKATVKKTVKLE